MFQADNVRDWRGRAVIDPEGHKIGTLEAVYVDTITDLPAFATVRTGMMGRRRLVFVPLDRATVGPEYLRVRASKRLATSAPAIETDGELAATQEPTVFEHYSLTYEPGARGERRLARR